MDEQRTANSSIDDYIASFPSIMSKIPSRAWLSTIAEVSFPNPLASTVMLSSEGRALGNALGKRRRGLGTNQPVVEVEE
jgi:hypothetical protein